MSVVCCRVYEDRIEIAADSINVRGWTQAKGENNDLAKIRKINGITLGSVGKAEEMVLMQMFCKTHQPIDNSIESLVEFIAEFSDWKKKKIDDSTISNSYIIVYKNKAYVTFGFAASEILTYEAIGAGEDFALASLYLGHCVTKSIETACELSVYCEKPVLMHKVDIENE